jgi:hypothetical protein
MKNHNFMNFGLGKFPMPACEGPKMQAADRTAGKAPEL